MGAWAHRAAAARSIVGGRVVIVGKCGAPLAQYIGPMLGTLFYTLHSRLRSLVPSVCAVCHAWPATPVCEHCVQMFAQPRLRCPGCALAMPVNLPMCGACVIQPPNWDHALAAVDYVFPWDRLIRAFKFHENPGWALHFAHLLRSAPWVEPALEAADWVVPVPLSAQRLRTRGFNQSALLARYLAPGKTIEGAVLRIRDTPAQSGLPRTERLRNMRNAFSLEPRMQAVLAGTHVVLLDDVMTTGASLAEVTAVLRHAGVRRVTVLVLARTPSD